MDGRVVKVLADRFAVDVHGSVVVVKSRKKIKRELLPLPGDFVRLEKVADEFVLHKIQPRKNAVIRPPVANADRIIITIAPVPEPDFIAVDKMIINANMAGIETVICVNKTDIAQNDFFEKVYAQYNGVVEDVVSVCALKGETKALTDILNNGFSCFAGQSAVGKTSLINAICGLNREVGDLSEKTLRGKNTTVGVELVRTSDNTYVADTPGFGSLDLSDIKPADLHLYYGEYVTLSGGCKYNMCTHTVEPDCAVCAAVRSGMLNKDRYERYLFILDELKKKNIHRKSWRSAYESK